METITAFTEQTLRTVTINGTEVTVKVISDNHPDIELAYRLWYEVYVEELKYPLSQGVNHQDKKLRLEPNGSWVFLAMNEGKCIGTTRTTSDNFSALEFDYGKYFPNTKQTELTKLLLAKKFRKSLLLFALLSITYKFHLSIISNSPFDNIVFNSNATLVPRYLAFGHRFITRKPQIHPTLKNECYLMYSSIAHWKLVDRYFERIIDGSWLVRIELALKYWWYKTFSN